MRYVESENKQDLRDMCLASNFSGKVQAWNKGQVKSFPIKRSSN